MRLLSIYNYVIIIDPPPPPPPPKKGCFPSSAKVNLEKGKVIRMSELQIGDKVQTGKFIKKSVLYIVAMSTMLMKRFFGLICLIFVLIFYSLKFISNISFIFHKKVSSNGIVTYNEVVAFLERHSKVITQYRSITTSSNDTLIATGNHLVYAKKHDTTQFNPM